MHWCPYLQLLHGVLELVLERVLVPVLVLDVASVVALVAVVVAVVVLVVMPLRPLLATVYGLVLVERKWGRDRLVRSNQIYFLWDCRRFV